MKRILQVAIVVALASSPALALAQDDETLPLIDYSQQAAPGTYVAHAPATRGHVAHAGDGYYADDNYYDDGHYDGGYYDSGYYSYGGPSIGLYFGGGGRHFHGGRHHRR